MRVRYRPPQAAEKIGATVSTLAKWRVYGTGPKFEKLGPKLIVYSEEALEEFLSARSHASTSEYPTKPGKGRPKRLEEADNTEKQGLEEESVKERRVNGRPRTAKEEKSNGD